MERRVIGWLYLLVLAAVVGTVIWIGAVACRPPLASPGACRTGEMRCHDNVAQICASDRTWIAALDCRAIGSHTGRPWVCALIPADAGPLEAEEFTCLEAGDLS